MLKPPLHRLSSHCKIFTAKKINGRSFCGTPANGCFLRLPYCFCLYRYYHADPDGLQRMKMAANQKTGICRHCESLVKRSGCILCCGCCIRYGVGTTLDNAADFWDLPKIRFISPKGMHVTSKVAAH